MKELERILIKPFGKYEVGKVQIFNGYDQEVEVTFQTVTKTGKKILAEAKGQAVRVGMALLFILLASMGAAQAQEDPEFSTEWPWGGIAVHITDSDNMSLEDCNAWHTARGWSGCGYNFVIEPDGNVYEARGFDRVGAHVKGHNSDLLGIAFVSKDGITPEQGEAFLNFISQNSERLGNLPIRGHNEFNKAKRCPGSALEEVKAMAAARGQKLNV